MFARLSVAAFLLCLAVPAVAEEPSAFPPLGERYDSIPQEAKEVVKSLKKLQARTEIGINFVDYDRAVSEVYPDVKVFVESVEARNMPELRFVLSNAMDCYLKVRELWAVKVSTNDAVKKFDVSNQLITTQPVLWQVAATNTTGASALLESPKEDLAKVQASISEGMSKLTVTSALRLAKEQLVEASRRNRAEDSGHPIPPHDPDIANLDLNSLLFQKPDYGDAIAPGDLNSFMPPIYSKVAPANAEGEIPLLQEGQRRGGVAGFFYKDTDAAKKAFDVIRSGFGQGRKRAKGLGDVAEITSSYGSTNLVFRRGGAVVHMRIPIESSDRAIASAKEIDSRLSKHFQPSGDEPEPEPEPTESSTEAAAKVSTELPGANPTGKTNEVRTGGGVADAGADTTGEKKASREEPELIDILFQDGDLGEKITSLGYSDSVPGMFLTLPTGVKKGSVAYAHEGARCGGVTGLVYGSQEEAKNAYEKIAAGFGRAAKKVSRVGSDAMAVCSAGSDTADLVFRRDVTVIHLRARADSIEEIAKGARKIDSRLRGSEGKSSVGDQPANQVSAMSPDNIDVPALVRSANEMLDDGGESARYAKTLISLSKTSEWKRRDEYAKPIKGTLARITDKEAVIETKSGPVTIPVRELAAESGAKVSRIRDMCKRMVSLGAEKPQ